ncbi:protein-transporting protein SEC63 NDAI_0K01230 [Naumovozyma dairenensis CBS 421]|uniref:J domain-containing protein n=1 Tax=Naumovozyma dairenensis (strain ATCC 10597 / BCRC 20456 / CBS 421 / NBRC 0211 / NRRL Y-12639) TaxID=1071378 RepID=G0WHQ3_NAUDC|nr:hypothetical protein NDAI_0K01230 [Naumovozyma dairenensis CBS 421]CCD27314.1 hypothetical protein NDAI_0K01230 [Naumovozyma dairenensis CBS 421]
MALNYDYDESSETWPFFLLTILLMLLIPLTLMQCYKLIYSKSKKDTRNHEDDKYSELEALNDIDTPEEIIKFRSKYTSKSKLSCLFNWKNLFIVVGWAVVFYLVQRISNNDAIKQAAIGIFDPYDILGISSSSSDKDIKSAYRKLSIKFHPDKLSKDLSADERIVMEEKYVQITKAYEALTDETVRENYLKYGHPDGPQSTSHGIALPSFMVEGSSSPILIMFYISLLGIVLPYFVSKWWSKTQSYTRKGIHTKTASYFVDRLVNYKPSEVVTVDLIIKWLSHAEEFKQFYPSLTSKDFEELLHDHINRKSSNEKGPDRNIIKNRIVAKCHSLLLGLLDIAAGFRNTDVANVTLDTFKCIVQAIPSNPKAELLQLPNVDKEQFENGSLDDIFTIGKLFTFDDERIGKILGIKDEKLLKRTLTVASNIPHIRLLKADFVVPGETQVTPLSTPHISLKVLIRSAKHKIINTESFPESMLSEPQDFEHQRNPFSIIEEQPLIPYSYSPYFPVKRRSAWCCLIALQKDNKIIQTPAIINNLSFHNLSKSLDKREVKMAGKDIKGFIPEDWEIGTIKVPLGQPAPNQEGAVYFRIILKNTDYFGADLDFTMTMNVREYSEKDLQQMREESYNNDDEDSDVDESEEELEESDDEGSDSEYTDIDTDTEVEEDAVEDREIKNNLLFI